MMMVMMMGAGAEGRAERKGRGRAEGGGRREGGCSQITAGLALAAVQTGSVCPLFALRLGSVLFGGGGGGGGSSSSGLSGTVVGAVVVVVLLMVLVGVVVVVVWSATVLHFSSQLPVLPPV